MRTAKKTIHQLRIIQILIQNDAETLTQNRAAKSETHNRKYNRILKQFQ